VLCGEVTQPCADFRLRAKAMQVYLAGRVRDRARMDVGVLKTRQDCATFKFNDPIRTAKPRRYARI
jgi:hypothetical protein